MSNQLNQLPQLVDMKRVQAENELFKARQIIENPTLSNLDALDIIRKILDVAPFIIAIFPEFKQKLLTVLEPIEAELSDLITNLKN